MRNSKSSHHHCPPRLHRPPHTQNTEIHLAFPWVFELLLNPTTNTTRRCGSSCHPTHVLCLFHTNALSQHTSPASSLRHHPSVSSHLHARALPAQQLSSSQGLLHGALLRTIAISATPLLVRSPSATVVSTVFPPSSPFGEPAKWNPFHASVTRSNLRSTAAPLPKLKKWVCPEFASLLSRATDVPALKQLPP
jgi:hypothetical protein